MEICNVDRAQVRHNGFRDASDGRGNKRASYPEAFRNAYDAGWTEGLRVWDAATPAWA